MPAEYLMHGTHAPAFCDCEFPQTIELASHKGHIPDLISTLVKCKCGENKDIHCLEWCWETDTDGDTIVAGRDITFHPIYSQGTTIVRGDKPLKLGMVHFWEMRIITALSGTDVMFGIGTDKVQLNQFNRHFVSALGTNNQSWGFSYNGFIQHNGVQQPYGQKFSQGCILGIYLDRIKGELMFYLNRRPLGIAYTNLHIDANTELYPMVCSTAAKSVIRLINSTSQLACLKLDAFKIIAKQPKILQELREMPGLRSLLQQYWFLAPPVRYSNRSTANELDILDEVVLPTTRLGRKQKFKDDEVDIDDLYTNAHKIATQRRERDEEHMMAEYFDEFFHYLF